MLHDNTLDLAGGTLTEATDELTDAATPQWHRPAVTRMSLDQTLAAPGSNLDGSGGTGTF